MLPDSPVPSVWHIITPEYPPDLGGVSDYSALVAHGLREAGEQVHVWCRASAEANASERYHAGDEWVHPQAHGFGLRAIRDIHRRLNGFARPRRLLVQWVPHGYGWRAMNIAFCVWLVLRAWRGDDVQIMLHEAFLDLRGGSWRQTIAAGVQRLMTAILFGSTRRVWMSSPSWKPRLAPYRLGRPIEFTWLPVPSTIPVVATQREVNELRTRYAPNGELLVGHFGTYGRSVSHMLDRIIPTLLAANPGTRLLLIGAQGDGYRAAMAASRPELADRIFATGSVDSSFVSRGLMACDLMIQPYPDGVTARRTSCLAGLSHGRPIVTTAGEMTEGFWEEAKSPVAFARNCAEMVAAATHLLADRDERARLGERAGRFYRENFALEHLIAMLKPGTGTNNEQLSTVPDERLTPFTTNEC